MAAASAARDGHLLLIRFAAMLCFSSLFPLLCGLAMASSAAATVRGLETPTDAPQAQCTMLHTNGELSPRSATDVPSTDIRTTAPRAYRKAMGFRVQVYTGFADRASRNAAIQMQKEISRRFPQIPVYVHFIAPRWTCRVGNFTRREEALRWARLLRAARLSSEAAVVASPILIRTPAAVQK